MDPLDQHRGATRAQVGHQGLGDVLGHALLDLEATREAIHQTRQLGEAHHPVSRQVGDVGAPVEGQHVVLAGRVEGDVLEQDELLVPFDLFEGRREDLGGVLVVAGEDLGPAAQDPVGSVLETLAVGILADDLEQRPKRLARAFLLTHRDLGFDRHGGLLVLTLIFRFGPGF
ncbi:hypothetical protein D3C86_1145590 [compost metagenome]